MIARWGECATCNKEKLCHVGIVMLGIQTREETNYIRSVSDPIGSAALNLKFNQVRPQANVIPCTNFSIETTESYAASHRLGSVRCYGKWLRYDVQTVNAIP